jgi:hypothetical protein
MQNEPRISWPASDLSRIPFAVYLTRPFTDEQTRVFRGPTWNIRAEAELLKPGDLVTTVLGDTPVLVGRDEGRAVSSSIAACTAACC